jgi:hypothetical protein
MENPRKQATFAPLLTRRRFGCQKVSRKSTKIVRATLIRSVRNAPVSLALYINSGTWPKAADLARAGRITFETSRHSLPP